MWLCARCEDACEVLFRACEDGSERPTLPQLVYRAASGIEQGAAWERRRELLRSIVLAGGASMLSGLPERLSWELRDGRAECVANSLADVLHDRHVRRVQLA